MASDRIVASIHQGVHQAIELMRQQGVDVRAINATVVVSVNAGVVNVETGHAPEAQTPVTIPLDEARDLAIVLPPDEDLTSAPDSPQARAIREAAAKPAAKRKPAPKKK